MPVGRIHPLGLKHNEGTPTVVGVPSWVLAAALDAAIRVQEREVRGLLDQGLPAAALSFEPAESFTE